MQQYGIEEYFDDPQIKKDYIYVALTLLAGFTIYFARFTPIFGKNEAIDAILKYGGDINEGYEYAFISNFFILYCKSKAREKTTKIFSTFVKTRILSAINEKKSIRLLSSVIGAMGISIAELFSISNDGNAEDIPAGLVGAFLFYIISKK